MSRKAKWRVWLDRDLNARWVESLNDMPTPEIVKQMLVEFEQAMMHKPVVLGPDFEIRVQP